MTTIPTDPDNPDAPRPTDPPDDPNPDVQPLDPNEPIEPIEPEVPTQPAHEKFDVDEEGTLLGKGDAQELQGDDAASGGSPD